MNVSTDQILKSVYSLFGEDIVKNISFSDEKYATKDDTFTEESISISNVGLVIEFINGKKIEIRGVYGWADILKVK